MIHSRYVLALMLWLSAPAAALAQTAPVTAPAAAPDPERLAIARDVAGKLMPDGIYERMLGQNFSQMMESMVGSASDIPLREFAATSGMDADEVAALGTVTLREVMAIYDPHWQERQQRMVRAMTVEVSKLMSTFEPKVREALARAYAREYPLAELQALQRFFETPAGAHYAGTSMEVMMGPDMVGAMSDVMPQMMQQMPALIASAEAATKDLPPPRKPGDLTPEERRKIAALVGRKSGESPKQ